MDSDNGSDFFTDPESDSSDNDSAETGGKIEVKETPAQKRRRLARTYLEEVRLEEQGDICPGMALVDLGHQLIRFLADILKGENSDIGIEERLKNDQLRARGKILNTYSSKICVPSVPDRLSIFRSSKTNKHLEVITSIESVSFAKKDGENLVHFRIGPANQDLTYIFSASKDGSVIKWDFHSKAPLIQYNHSRDANSERSKDEVLSISSSSDGKFLVSI